MNTEEMKQRAECATAIALDLQADDDDAYPEYGDLLKDRREYALAAGALAADVLALITENERLVIELRGTAGKLHRAEGLAEP